MKKKEEREGILISVFSTAFSAGKTLIAVNLAAEMARQGFRVCLIDLDLQFGDVANFLQIGYEHTLYTVQKDLERGRQITDPVSYVSSYTYRNVSFSALPAPYKLEESCNVSTETIEKFITEIQKQYDYIILDTTSSFNKLNLKVLSMSTFIVWVAIIDFLPTVKNMKLGLDFLKKSGIDINKVRLILNRSNAKTNIDVKDVEKLLDEQFYHVLPNDFKAAAESIYSGIPLVLDDIKRETELGESMRNLACMVTNRMGVSDREKEESPSRISKLFKRWK